MIAGKSLETWRAEFPLLQDLMDLEETSWFTPMVTPTAEALAEVGLSTADIDAGGR